MAENCQMMDDPIKGTIVKNAKFNGSNWQIRVKSYEENGDIRYRVIKGFSTAEEANLQKAEFDRKFERDARRWGMASTVAADISVQEYLKYYLEEVLGSYCEPSTEMVYRYTLYKHILPHWVKETRLSLVNSDEINQLLEVLASESRIAANKAREFLYLALKHACNNEKRIAHIPMMRKCPRPNPKVNILTKEEMKKLLEAASGTEWYFEVLLALFMGLRKGEILGLKFADFDAKTQTVSISRQLATNAVYETGGYRRVSSEKTEKPPKTDNSIRILHVPDYVWNEFEKRCRRIEKEKQAAGEKYEDHDYVSCTKLGKPRGTASFNIALSKLCARNGIKHMTVHGLRHCYASILLEQKYELPVISALLGHSSINTTYEFYADIIEANNEILTCLNELYAVENEESEELV